MTPSRGHLGAPHKPRPPFDDTDLLIFGAKTCDHCHAALPANTEQFNTDHHEVDGLTKACRDCRNANGRAYHERKLRQAPVTP